MTPIEAFHARLKSCSLVAILRGIAPDEVEAIGEALVEAGFGIVEVPLNSPHPLKSIEKLAKRLGERALVGAGTVTTEAEVLAVRDAGGGLIVSPHVDGEVIAATVQAGMISLPGFFTPSEAFAALGAGAHGLKLFPAEGASPAMLKALRAVLPADVPVLAVGGITPPRMAPWLAAGATGFGLGSALYKSGLSAAEVRQRAAGFIAAMEEAPADPRK
jgi:2-dehydro-3-deoxyphosphogalactonate aldolase